MIFFLSSVRVRITINTANIPTINGRIYGGGREPLNVLGKNTQRVRSREQSGDQRSKWPLG